LGPSASGTVIFDDEKEAVHGIRITCDRQLHRVNGGAPKPGIEELDAGTLIKESLLMGFRLLQGPNAVLFKRRFGKSIEEFIPETLSSFGQRGLLQGGRIALNAEGLLLLNTFLVSAFCELETGKFKPLFSPAYSGKINGNKNRIINNLMEGNL
jgi:coproporphyrinogen III oxidase-like Fe-S oxidoreductase